MARHESARAGFFYVRWPRSENADRTVKNSCWKSLAGKSTISMAIFNSFLYVYQRVSHHIIICKILETHFFWNIDFGYIYISRIQSMGFWKHHFFLGGVGNPRDWTLGSWQIILQILDLLGEWVAQKVAREAWLMIPIWYFFPQKTMENRDRNSWYTQLENGDFP